MIQTVRSCDHKPPSLSHLPSPMMPTSFFPALHRQATSPRHQADSAPRMDDNAEISVVARRCKHVFETCVANPAVAQQPWLRSAQGDFNLWCAATKAISTSKSSLGHCLRNKEGARAAICGLIRALGDSIETCCDASVSGLCLSTRSGHCTG